jgi:polyhydroxyalkanoate synthesis regulator protein
MQFLVPGYLEQAMVAFAQNQEQIRKNLQATFGIFPFGQFEEMGKQNMALFERTLRMLAPFGPEEKPSSPDTGPSRASDDDPRLKRLEAQIDALTRQLKGTGQSRDEP